MPPLASLDGLHDDLSRRLFHTGAAAAGLLPACGSDATSGPAPAAAGSGFPVTLPHRYGSTTIPAEPKRVVCVGEGEQDALLALGIVPLAVDGNPATVAAPRR